MIRVAAARDGTAAAAIYAPCVLHEATSFEVVPPDGDEMARRIASIIEHYPWLVYESAGSVIGYAYASRHRDRHAYQWSVDVTIYVDGSRHREGIGTALYERLFEILRQQQFVNAYAGITLPNPRSVGFHEAMGFRRVADYEGVGYKFDRWHDTAWFALQLRDREPSPRDPIPFPEIRARLGLG